MSTTLETFIKSKEALVEEYKTKQKEVADMLKELVALGIMQDESTKKKKAASGPRKSWPKVDLEAITTIVKAKGKDGCAAGDLAKHFGQSFAKWRKDNKKDIDKNFSITKDGTSRIWKVK